ncbi:DUF433 domain-containing protein [Candidatus Thiosymbion oneisti]|uniref:DUF433 domain-containing protein n=1 Tax=Candidatus Thiosymbion oneisti TaxID=589554 RepID=UPI001C4083E7|nr:DUF433 domain-containing protein [Candidatus Thiosymbion oneisti]
MDKSTIDFFDVVSIDLERMGGEPCFKNTRVPIKVLFDHIDKLDEFFDGFPSVTHEQVNKVLSLAGQTFLSLCYEYNNKDKKTVA